MSVNVAEVVHERPCPSGPRSGCGSARRSRTRRSPRARSRRGSRGRCRARRARGVCFRSSSTSPQGAPDADAKPVRCLSGAVDRDRRWRGTSRWRRRTQPSRSCGRSSSGWSSTGRRSRRRRHVSASSSRGSRETAATCSPATCARRPRRSSARPTASPSARSGISAAGAQIKSLEEGLLDFPARRGDENVLLCWKLGEDEIEYWHGVDEGFAGTEAVRVRWQARRPICLTAEGSFATVARPSRASTAPTSRGGSRSTAVLVRDGRTRRCSIDTGLGPKPRAFLPSAERESARRSSRARARARRRRPRRAHAPARRPRRLGRVFPNARYVVHERRLESYFMSEASLAAAAAPSERSSLCATLGLVELVNGETEIVSGRAPRPDARPHARPHERVHRVRARRARRPRRRRRARSCKSPIRTRLRQRRRRPGRGGDTAPRPRVSSPTRTDVIVSHFPGAAGSARTGPVALVAEGRPPSNRGACPLGSASDRRRRGHARHHRRRAA